MAQDLMRGGAELMSLAVLATRAQSAAQRATNSTPSVEDSQALTSLARQLDDVAKSIRFFDTRGQAGSAPSGAVASQVEVTLETVAHSRSGTTDREQVATELGRLAGIARNVLNGQTDATELVAFCTGLAESVLRQTRRSGEITAAL